MTHFLNALKTLALKAKHYISIGLTCVTSHFLQHRKKHTLWGKGFFGEPLPTWQAHGFMQLPLSFRGFIYCSAGVSVVVS